MKLLTLLEDAIYQQTTFTWNKQTFTTCFSPVASCQILKPDQLYVFLTKEAFQNVYPAFKESLPKSIPVQPITIPAGSTPEELWEIARLLDQTIEDHDEIAFDITHGPLSFPLVALTVAIYVRITRDISLKAILYGAYGIDRGVQTDRTPIFDLAPMLAWVEWFNAVDRYIQTANFDTLAILLKEHRRNLASGVRSDKKLRSELGNLGKLNGVLENISSSLHMIRPYQAMEHIADLEDRLEKARPLLGNPGEAISYHMLFDGLVKAYAPLGLNSPDDPTNAEQTLLTERRLINWYAQREYWVEANTLAREWLISWVMYHLNLSDFTQPTSRQRVESVLAAEAHDYLYAKKQKINYGPIFLGNIPEIEKVLTLWLELIDVRNDINHAGMRKAPSTPKSLVARSRKNLQLLNELPDYFESDIQS